MTAPWQVEFHLVPKAALRGAFHGTDARTLESTDWWTGHRFPFDYRDRLAASGPALAGTTPGLESWGITEGNRIDVHASGGQVRRVTALVDVRRLDAKFSAALLTFVRVADAALVRSDGPIIEPSITAFAAALRGSGAWKHASPTTAPPIAGEVHDDDD